MLSVLSELLVGVAANGLYDLLHRGGRDGAGDQRASAASIVEKALASLDHLPSALDKLDKETVKEFLSSPETQYLVRQIYASADASTTEADLREEFWQLWVIKTGIADGVHPEIDLLFDSLLTLCERALDTAIAGGDLSALEARSARQHRYLRDAFLGIERTLEVLANSSSLSSSAVEEFATRYRNQVARREGVIVPPALDAARDFPIDDLYVPPRFAPPWEGEEDIDYREFASELYSSVVLGNPGSGKSTLAKKLATDVATDKVALPTLSAGAVPFLVILRDYGARKKEAPCSILDFITATCNSRYQIQPPPGVIEYLLATNRSLVIFDGLDELLDTTYRAEISADVQSFASLYPAIPLLVTSREVGYDQAPLPSPAFSTYGLTAFTEEDVYQYAKRWFAVGSDVAPEDAAATADRFMADSSSVSDLRANALMLGLMCNLYKGSGYIPRNRPDVYEACADMLFDRWDRLRQIQVGLNIESHIKTSMQHLAFWIYQDPDLQSGVTESALVREAAGYLKGRRFDTLEEAESEAHKFIEFCRGRAWVFTDTGTTPEGDRLYQFTHRTFLEFFAARHLARTNPTPEQLLKVLTPHLSAKEWDVVAQLSFQILEKNVEGAADALLNALLPTEPDPTDISQANRLDFAVRSLGFLVPSPLTTRRLADAALDMAIAWAVHCSKPKKEQWVTTNAENYPIDSVIGLLSANLENVSPIRESLVQGLRRYLHDPETSAPAAELGLNLRQRGRGEPGADPGAEIEQALLQEEGQRLRQIAETESGVACDLVVLEQLSVANFLSIHGLDAFFNHRLYWLFPQSGRVPLADLIFGGLLWGASTGVSLQFLLRSLKEVGDVLEASTPPWYKPSDRWFAGSAWGFDYRRDTGAPRLEDVTSLDAPEKFALVGIAAAAAEEAQALDDSRGVSGLADLLENAPSDAAVWTAIAPIFRAKLQLASLEEGLAALADLGLPEGGRRLLERWLEGGEPLVELASPDSIEDV